MYWCQSTNNNQINGFLTVMSTIEKILSNQDKQSQYSSLLGIYHNMHGVLCYLSFDSQTKTLVNANWRHLLVWSSEPTTGPASKEWYSYWRMIDRRKEEDNVMSSWEDIILYSLSAARKNTSPYAKKYSEQLHKLQNSTKSFPQHC